MGAFPKFHDVAGTKLIVEPGFGLAPHVQCNRAFAEQSAGQGQLEGDGVAISLQSNAVHQGLPRASLSVVFAKLFDKLSDEFAHVFNSHRATAFVMIGTSLCIEDRAHAFAGHKFCKEHVRAMLRRVGDFLSHRFPPSVLFAFRCNPPVVTVHDKMTRVKFRSRNDSVYPQSFGLSASAYVEAGRAFA